MKNRGAINKKYKKLKDSTFEAFNSILNHNVLKISKSDLA